MFYLSTVCNTVNRLELKLYNIYKYVYMYIKSKLRKQNNLYKQSNLGSKLDIFFYNINFNILFARIIYNILINSNTQVNILTSYR